MDAQTPDQNTAKSSSELFAARFLQGTPAQPPAAAIAIVLIIVIIIVVVAPSWTPRRVVVIIVISFSPRAIIFVIVSAARYGLVSLYRFEIIGVAASPAASGLGLLVLGNFQFLSAVAIELLARLAVFSREGLVADRTIDRITSLLRRGWPLCSKGVQIDLIGLVLACHRPKTLAKASIRVWTMDDRKRNVFSCCKTHNPSLYGRSSTILI